MLDINKNCALSVSMNCYTVLQVYNRLQKLMISMSHPTTLSIIDRLGEGHNVPVLNWKLSLQQRLEVHFI